MCIAQMPTPAVGSFPVPVTQPETEVATSSAETNADTCDSMSVQTEQRELSKERPARFAHAYTRYKRTIGRIRQGLSSVLVAASVTLLPHTAMALPIEEVLNTGEFSIFLAALKKSGVWDRMTSADSVNLFLISDTALRNEGSAFLLGTVYMTKGAQRSLFNLMSYHVSFAAPLLPDQMPREVKLGMSAGACLPVWKTGGGIRVGPEAVVTGVTRVDNGIIYLIDRLLWQPWQDEERCDDVVATAPSLQR
jgi:uncharacterized surface protein with fasciclin (FAS1) repeats